MQQGLLLKGIGGFYYVQTEAGELLTCKARGKFRSIHETPAIGDRVEVDIPREGYSVLFRILPRKNLLVRPPVANIDQLVIVAAASAPQPDWLLIDKLIVQAFHAGIVPILVLNKLDEQNDAIVKTFYADYAGHFTVRMVSTVTGEGMAELKALLPDKITCFAGQSAVGKSSLLNSILPELSLETGALAKKTERGRHTTRHAELWPYEGGAMLDTPGFSLYESELFEQRDLDRYYPEFSSISEQCRFSGCRHRTEPDCAVKRLLETGGLSQGRYTRYCQLSEEIDTRRKHQYD